jgi:hypothetical protein
VSNAFTPDDTAPCAPALGNTGERTGGAGTPGMSSQIQPQKGGDRPPMDADGRR